MSCGMLEHPCNTYTNRRFIAVGDQMSLTSISKAFQVSSQYHGEAVDHHYAETMADLRCRII
jgi:hypothetical protein